MMLRNLCLGLFSLIALSATPVLKRHIISGFAQGTDYSITYYATDSIATKKGIDSLLHEIDLSMSLYKKGSLINQFNSGRDSLKTDRFLHDVLLRSFEINSDTKGIFDITVAPLVQAWGFGPKVQKTEPIALEIKSILKSTGMKHLRLENGWIIKDKPSVQIDLNGIAQGYSVDLIAKHLEEKGIKNFVAELGGEIRIEGRKPNGESFKIGIEGPDKNGIPIMRHIVELESGAITTSGNYTKFHQSGQKKISHLINPKTGYPLENEMISVTLYAKDGITADGYDNALMGMPIKKALKFVGQRKNMEAYFVYRAKNGQIVDTLTTGFKKLLTK